MKCSRPFTQGVTEFGCGQCMPCRLNRRRLWTSRLMLEARRHKHSVFLTLTYKPEEYPKDASVSVREMQLFLKKLRKSVGSCRYYVVGEYGDRSGRAHYHLALFGVPEVVDYERIWGKGRVHVGTLTVESAGYIVSYVVKSMTRKTDVRLDGRSPEFARMSLKPGIGADAVTAFGKVIREGVDINTGECYGYVDGDVPTNFIYSGRRYPLGRYLRRKLREYLGMEVAEKPVLGQLRSFKRFVDLSVHGKSGWRVREAQREEAAIRARTYHQLALDRKGIGL